MLKRLELIGFKSFADRTRFDFAPGVTAVVGPNGSGKSNIVDAVKWILGEQSAKSLRGGEMADVIFNGSSTRKSLGLAEVTMTFDNSKRQLLFDGDEVQVTRRVHRDGQGEYLINGTTARLKDIREMFLGSGAGQGAYSIIEQGRVDALLVASTKDRRQIFEEAAGISRFRARKLEAIRKLEKVDADLNRVRDILQELEKNLQKLSAQAAKAQKYREHHDRLRELRIRVGRQEFRELAETLEYQEGVLANLRTAVADATEKTDAGEAALAKLGREINRADEAIHGEEKRLGESRHIIAEQEAAARSGREQAANLEEDLLRLSRQRIELTARVRALDDERARVAAEADEAEQSVAAEQNRADAAAAALNVVMATIAELTRQSAADRDRQFEVVGRAAQHHSTAEMNKAQVERLVREQMRKNAEAERASAEATTLGRALDELSRSDADVQHRLAIIRSALATLQQEQAGHRRRADALQPEMDSQRERRGSLLGRVDVLSNLERSQEGVGAGVRAVMERSNPADPIVGLVADLLTVPRDLASLVEIALGERAQQLVIRPDHLDEILTRTNDLPGRVGFVPLRGVGTVLPGSLADAVDCVQPELPAQLLGNVLVAADLAAARTIREQLPMSRVVTRTGELLEPDGTVTIGPLHSDSGIVFRKSELRALREQLQELEANIARLETEQSGLRQQAEQLDSPIASYEAEIQTLAGEAGTLRDRILEQRQRRDRLIEQAELASNEAAILSRELAKAEAAWQTARDSAGTADAEAAEIKTRLVQAEEQMRLAETARDLRQSENTAAQVALTSVKQRLHSLKSRRTELEGEIKQRKIDAINVTTATRLAQSRATDCQLAMLRATAMAAKAYGEKELREAAIANWSGQRDTLRAERDRLQDELKSIRDAWKQRQDQAHAHELTVRDLVNRRDGIVGRLREDYGIELADLANDAVPNELSNDDMQDEIDELKRKIAKLGSVNLEALEQLAVEEAREKAIRTEYDDLNAAEKDLLAIIEQINADSRTRFAETLKTVTAHFQELFRKLFGGGMADIVLEDPNDILETGIEITARPPGKELRSISLLSGGEKTLTAIALLLAIFRSRPSPFCLLDEVDAALDEANTARLADIIKEFREKSQFIIVTHKKRTMAMADVLHGVTMQESGVSKQVATRIDDWPEEPSAAA